MSILKKADKLVNADRKAEYGDAYESFTRIGKITSLILSRDEWELVIGKVIPPTVICKMLIALKLSRESFLHKEDNLVDLAGYTDLLQKLQDILEQEVSQEIEDDDKHHDILKSIKEGRI